METVSTKTTTKSFSHTQLLQALYFVYDLFDRPYIPFFLTHETAKSVSEGQPLSGDGIDCGVLEKDMSQSGFEVMQIFWKAKSKTDKLIEYEFEGVPIRIHIYKKPIQLVKNPNLVMYESESFYIPNQMDKYWKLKNSFI